MTWTTGLIGENGEPEVSNSSNNWDIVQFASHICPGVATVDSSAPANLDKQKQSGAKGSRMVDKGDDPIEFDIEIKLQPAEFEEFKEDILPLLRPKSANDGRPPLGFYHPLAEFWGIDTVIVGDIDVPAPKPGSVLIVKFKAFQWIDEAPKVRAQVEPIKAESDAGDYLFTDFATVDVPSASDAYQTDTLSVPP